VSADNQNDDYTAWLMRVEDELQLRHAVKPPQAYAMVNKAEEDGVLNYDTQRAGKPGFVDFWELGRRVKAYWDKLNAIHAG